MKTTGIRLYGKSDIRLEEFELPAIKDCEILAEIISDSLCMSSYKAAIQGENHKRVPADIAENPVLLGHEMCGIILEVGAKWADKYKAGQRFVMQTALNYKGTLDSPGYTYKYVGGDATHVIIPNEVMELDCLIPFECEAFYQGSIVEPLSCVIGAYNANYHTKAGSYEHKMGIKENGTMALLAGVGPMGLAAIDYIIHAKLHPSFLVVTDIDDARLARASQILPPEEAAKNGITLKYVNTGAFADPASELLALNGGKGFDDVFVFAPVAPVVEQADKILGKDGCLNFFAGPTNTEFSAKFNFYNVHYASTHLVGTSGGNTNDMRIAIDMMEKKLLTPSILITHIGGLTAAAEATLNLPKIPGGKKLIYTHLDMKLTAIADFASLGETDPMFKKLDELVKANNGLWSADAEAYLLANAKKL